MLKLLKDVTQTVTLLASELRVGDVPLPARVGGTLESAEGGVDWGPAAGCWTGMSRGLLPSVTSIAASAWGIPQALPR